MKYQKLHYWLAAILTGVFLSAMIYINAMLGGLTSPYWAAFISHFLGFLLLLPLIFTSNFLRKLHSQFDQIPYWAFCGGIAGTVLTIIEVVSVNSPLGLTASIAFFILGQVCFSIVVDYFGLFNMKKRPLTIRKMFEIVFIFGGSIILIYY